MDKNEEKVQFTFQEKFFGGWLNAHYIEDGLFSSPPVFFHALHEISTRFISKKNSIVCFSGELISKQLYEANCTSTDLANYLLWLARNARRITRMPVVFLGFGFHVGKETAVEMHADAMRQLRDQNANLMKDQLYFTDLLSYSE